MLETAIIFPVFFYMLIATMDFAQFLFVQNAITERVRGAVSYGITNAADTTGIKNIVLYGQTTAGASASFGLTPSNVVVSELDAGTDDHRLQVNITNFKYSILTPLMFGTYNSPATTAVLPLPLNE